MRQLLPALDGCVSDEKAFIQPHNHHFQCLYDFAINLGTSGVAGAYQISLTTDQRKRKRKRTIFGRSFYTFDYGADLVRATFL